MISTVIPAYNEEKTISNVISTVKQVKYIDEIIVVSDGSEDNTALTAKRCGVKVLELSENMGKGAAVKAGLEHSRGDIILFLDADLIGQRAAHVENLLGPVLRDEADMTIGIFVNGRLRTDLAHRISPHLSGQRAVKRYVLDSIDNMEITGYGIEMALTAYAEKENIRVCEVKLSEMTHIMKEEKLGYFRGSFERFKMYWHIIRGTRLVKR